jgi:hypothetical protein
MTDEELNAIEARANAAMAGPWFSYYAGSSDWVIETTESESHIATCYRRHAGECPDASFIANARTDVPALVAEIRRIKQEMYQEALDDMRQLAAPLFAELEKRKEGA